MIEMDIIFSINVHEKKDFLIKQIKNIIYFLTVYTLNLIRKT